MHSAIRAKSAGDNLPACVWCHETVVCIASPDMQSKMKHTFWVYSAINIYIS